MKALTLTQPWATLVAIGAKRIETRSWKTDYRGPMAIHAAKGFPREAVEVCFLEPFATALKAAGILKPRDLPVGAVLAVSELDSIWGFIPSSEAYIRELSADGVLPPHEADFGDYAPGRSGLLLKDVRSLATPIPARGMLGLWDLSPELFDAICEQTGGRP